MKLRAAPEALVTLRNLRRPGSPILWGGLTLSDGGGLFDAIASEAFVLKGRVRRHLIAGSPWSDRHIRELGQLVNMGRLGVTALAP
jgi:hypothetical protein